MVLLPDQPYHGYLVIRYTSSFSHPYYKGRLLLGIFIPPVAAVRAPPVWNASGVVTRDFSGDSRLPKWYFWWTLFFSHPAVSESKWGGASSRIPVSIFHINYRKSATRTNLCPSQSGIPFKEGSQPSWPFLETTLFSIHSMSIVMY